MSDIIQLLPDNVANQIAAGEVIQRPASVIKELTENAIDAGATDIQIIIKDAGKTLIKVIDNGCGMSVTDARMCFERHATSKLQCADDLFNLHTKGFRGEAMASIAAIAEVELLTSRSTDEVGTKLTIKASEFIAQEPAQCNIGTTISVKNLFYNVPARRKFLKSDSAEIKHLLTEIQRVAIAHSDIAFKVKHNDTLILQLDKSNLRQRIVALMGKSINQHLIDINVKTELINITGYICKPEAAKKRFGEQFFFVNSRFMKHPYFHRSVTGAYEDLLPIDHIPAYFIFFDVNPNDIDVNIHPTKTEIKFENEQAIWQIIQASIRESLGKYNIVPSIDFDTQGLMDIPSNVGFKEDSVKAPSVEINPFFNPFDYNGGGSFNGGSSREEANLQNWETLHNNFENPQQQSFDSYSNQQFASNTENKISSAINSSSQANTEFSEESLQKKYLQIKGRYIATPVKSGLMIIDQHRAHLRTLYDRYTKIVAGSSNHSQICMFPIQIELGTIDYQLILSISEELGKLGFDIADLGTNTIVINSYPAECDGVDIKDILNAILNDFKENTLSMENYIRERLLISLAKSAAIPYGKQLDLREMKLIVDELFISPIPNLTPDNKKIINILKMEDLADLF